MGAVRKLWIEGPAGRLEAALRIAESARAAAVVAHPHPLHGGSLHNPVVFHADRALNRSGFHTLRFNFRGVGSSQGAHDAGRGEVADLAAATSWMRGVSGSLPLLLVGYSFGALCAIRHAVGDPSVAALVAIGLPTRLVVAERLGRLRQPLAVVQGSEDELGAPGEVREWLDGFQADARLLEVPGASHLFAGRATEAAAKVTEAARALLRSPG